MYKHPVSHAIARSIEAWEAKRDETDPYKIKLGRTGCPLCQWSMVESGKDYVDCERCPIAQMTRQNGCLSSPYNEAREARAKWMERNHDLTTYPALRANFRHRAQQEIDFLRGVLAWQETQP